MELRKIIDLKKSKGQKGKPKTDKQRIAAGRAATIRLLTNNPMKDPKVADKVRIKRKGKAPSNAFEKGNQSTRFKGHKHSDTSKALVGLANLGNRHTEQFKESVKKRNLENNPMKDPKVADKVRIKRKGHMPKNSPMIKGNALGKKFGPGHTPWNKGHAKSQTMKKEVDQT